jgi:hypothetical protein
LNEGLRNLRPGADYCCMDKVRLIRVLLLAALFALMLAGGHFHHPVGMSDGGYW